MEGMSWNGAGIELLGGFEASYAGARIPLPVGARHLLAFLALHGDGVLRSTAAEQLWPDCTRCRAAANLRSALCQGRRVGSVTAIENVGERLRLTPSTRVDLHRAWTKAQQVLSGHSVLSAGSDDFVNDFCGELLPGWEEKWLLLERERWDQTRLHALESLAQQLRSEEHYLSAIQTALAAIEIDPIRETAHRIVVEVHMAEGNVASALKSYQHYRAFLQRELNVAPSPMMTRLVQNLMCT